MPGISVISETFAHRGRITTHALRFTTILQLIETKLQRLAGRLIIVQRQSITSLCPTLDPRYKGLLNAVEAASAQDSGDDSASSAGIIEA